MYASISSDFPTFFTKEKTNCREWFFPKGKKSLDIWGFRNVK